MADRQDIDALMVGALYGELDAAERTRLEAHLSSHPEDRAAMQELESTRATVRRGMSEMASAEPPQAVSAILLQEAARRRGAVAATEPAEREGLWDRFVAWFRPLSQHPALAAAAMLILVAGTATALWVRGKGKDSGQTVSESSGATATAAESTAPPSAYRTEVVPGGDSNAAAGAAMGSGSAVAMADPAPITADLDEAEVKKESPQRDTAPASGKGASRSAKASKSSTEMGIAVGGVPSAPDIKDLEEADSVAAEAEGPGDGYAQKPATSARGGAPEPEPKSADPKLDAWAQREHQKLVKLVEEGNCPAAGRVGATIKAKAPEYYAANVAQDRDVRQCKSYIEKQAKKQAEKNYKSRSQGNTYDDDLAADEATK